LRFHHAGERNEFTFFRIVNGPFLTDGQKLVQIDDALISAVLIDNVQRIALSRPCSDRAEKGAQGTNVASLAPDDFPHVGFRHFQLDLVVFEVIDIDLIGRVDHPLRDLLDQKANVCSLLSHKLYATETAAAGKGLE